MHEATTSQGPWVHIPDDMHYRPNTRFRLELGDRLSTLLIEVGVCPALMQEIMEDPTLLEIWRQMSRDLNPLMLHIVRVARLLAARRAPDDRHDSSSNINRSSNTP